MRFCFLCQKLWAVPLKANRAVPVLSPEPKLLIGRESRATVRPSNRACLHRPWSLRSLPEVNAITQNPFSVVTFQTANKDHCAPDRTATRWSCDPAPVDIESHHMTAKQLLSIQTFIQRFSESKFRTFSDIPQNEFFTSSCVCSRGVSLVSSRRPVNAEPGPLTKLRRIKNLILASGRHESSVGGGKLKGRFAQESKLIFSTWGWCLLTGSKQ